MFTSATRPLPLDNTAPHASLHLPGSRIDDVAAARVPALDI
jgi:hypothetical protein